MTSPSATQDSYPYQNEPIWSRSEKAVARTALRRCSEAGASGGNAGNKTDAQSPQMTFPGGEP